MISAVSPNPSLLDGLAALTRVGVVRPSRLGRTEAPSSTTPVDPARLGDHVELSPEAQAAADGSRVRDGEDGHVEPTPPPQTTDTKQEQPNGTTLSDEEREQVRKLEQRDREVRNHEQAHKAAGGAHAGGISYSYESGPDGRRYATGGEVPIDVSPAEDPDATIRKMQQVRRAALAPAEPSSADRAVAAKAQQTERQARSEQRETPATDAAAESTGSSATTAAYGGQTHPEPELIDVIA